MADTITLKLVTPGAKLFDGEATSFVAPGKDGEFGILPGHDPWLVALGMGLLKVVTPGGDEQTFFLSGGYCRIDSDQVDILAEICESSLDINLERAKAAHARAQERVTEAMKNEDIDVFRAEAALRRALSRIDIGGD